MARSLNILVVDGSRASRTIITKALMLEINADIKISAVATAREALALLARNHYDLITSALLLPDRYGLDLCRAVRRTTEHRFTPFIVITAEPHRCLTKDGFSAGVTDYYDKTQGFKNFVQFIRAFTERHAGLAGKVLYLEDNYMEAKLTTAVMEQHGLEVQRVASAEQALSSLDDSHDLVVVDFFLANEMSGGDFLHNVRCGLRHSREELPILVVTGGDDPNMQAEVFHAGANDFVTKPVIGEVLMSRIRSLLLIKQRFRQLKRQSEAMRLMANVDVLTGVYNKRYLTELAEPLLQESGHGVCIAVIDLDHFKAINDTYGHLKGDEVLKGVGRLLGQFFAGSDLVARAGGEEFVTLLMNRDVETCRRELEALRRQIEELSPGGMRITASIGATMNTDRPQARFNELLREADMAMYRAKQRGRNQVVMSGDMGPPFSCDDKTIQ